MPPRFVVLIAVIVLSARREPAFAQEQSGAGRLRGRWNN